MQWLVIGGLGFVAFGNLGSAVLSWSQTGELGVTSLVVAFVLGLEALVLFAIMRALATSIVRLTDTGIEYANYRKEGFLAYEELESIRGAYIPYLGGWVTLKGPEDVTLRLTVVLDDIDTFVKKLYHAVEDQPNPPFDRDNLFGFYKTAALSDFSWDRVYRGYDSGWLIFGALVVCVGMVVFALRGASTASLILGGLFFGVLTPAIFFFFAQFIISLWYITSKADPEAFAIPKEFPPEAQKKYTRRVLAGCVGFTAILALFLGVVSHQTNTQADRFTAQESQWARLLGGPQTDHGHTLTHDGAGNIYIGGFTETALPENTYAGAHDAFVASYSASGKMRWVRQFGGCNNEDVTAAVTDSSGNLYVAGYTKSAELVTTKNSGGKDAFLGKYDQSGNLQWMELLGGNSDDEGWAVDVDEAGDVYLVGTTENDLRGQRNNGNEDLFLAKYSSSGSPAWLRLIGGPDKEETGGVTTESGNVYVTGETYGNVLGERNAGKEDLFLTRYNQQGERSWFKMFGTPGKDDVEHLASDDRGTLYLAGRTGGDLAGQKNNGNLDAFILACSASSDRKWGALVGGSDDDQAYSVAAKNDRIYLAGHTRNDLSGPNDSMSLFRHNTLVAELNAEGNKQHVYDVGHDSLFALPDTMWDGGSGVTLTDQGDVYIGGTTGNSLGEQSASKRVWGLL